MAIGHDDILLINIKVYLVCLMEAASQIYSQQSPNKPCE